MQHKFGQNRVLEPKHLFPTSAWRLDPAKKINADEVRVAIKKIHVEASSFRQIYLESNGNDEVFKHIVLDIVSRRGKLHNPVTDTGGLVYGVIEEIGSEYTNARNLKVGDEVICNASLTSMPMYIEKINDIDFGYNQIFAEGHVIVYNNISLVEKPKDVPINLLMYIFNESATIYKVYKLAKEKERILVLGNSPLLNLVYGYTIRKAVGNKAYIVNILDTKVDTILAKGKIDELAEWTFDEQAEERLLYSRDVVSNVEKKELFDMTVNCADISGAETVNLFATKDGGNIVFTNLVNNFNIALYVTETLGKNLSINRAEGYMEGYEDFVVDIARELAPFFKGATATMAHKKNTVIDDENLLKGQRFLAEDFITESRVMNIVIDEIMNVSKYDCNVMLTGDTGVGKDKIANLVQKNSSRKMQPFIKINCAAIAHNLMESEFFGYEAGSFTGAKTEGKKGYFEAADNGIVFLDEVGELPLDMQAKLLRVIQDGEFFRVGGTVPVKTDVRIISATNRDLESQIEKKQFRSDLYYRLNVFPIKIPSLRERKEDIAVLAKYFIEKYSDKFGIIRGVEDEAIEYLSEREWPGNIRELENVIQRLLISSRGEEITVMDVMKELHSDIFANGGSAYKAGSLDTIDVNLDVLMEGIEKEIIRKAYYKYGSTRKAAKSLGISQTQMVRKKNKYNIEEKEDE